MPPNPTQINLANLFIFNMDYGQKEGREAEKIFYFYPGDELLERQARLVGFCAGMIAFTQRFNPKKPCEYVHTEKTRMIFYQADKNFWMVISLDVPVSASDKNVYENDQICNSIYMSVLKQTYNYYKLFNGPMSESLAVVGHEKLRLNLKSFFDNYIGNKLNIRDCDIMNTFNGIHFMSLERGIYLKIQSLLNLLEEKVPLVERTVVMHNDQVIWSGLEQNDIALIYTYLKELINSKQSTSAASAQVAAKFLVHDSIRKKLAQSASTASLLQRSTQQQQPSTSRDVSAAQITSDSNVLQILNEVQKSFSRLLDL